jgi:hypothetical protein
MLGRVRHEHRCDAIIEPMYPVEQKDPRFLDHTGVLAQQFGHRDGEGFTDSRYLRGISHNIGYYVYRDEPAYRMSADGAKHPMTVNAPLDAVPGVDGLYVSWRT